MRVDLDLRNLDAVEFVSLIRPFYSVGLQLNYAFHWAPGRLPGEWRRQILRTVDRGLRPMLAPLRYFLPSELLGGPRSLSGIAGRISDSRDSGGDWIPPFLETGWPALPEVLRPVQRRPREFLATALTAAEQASTVTRRIWPLTRPLLDREERRIASSVTSTAKRHLLASLLAQGRLVGDRLISAAGSPAEEAVLLPLDRKVNLVPVLAGPSGGGIGVNDSFTRVDQIVYPLPGLDRVIDGRPIEAEPDPLDLLLGPLRSQILRSLDQPLTVSQLGQATAGPLSKITYHCDQLEAVGLVHRERSGNRVWVWRTVRGDQLLQLMI
jgi:DNA-binding transcriptional ArsR family regulator